MRLPLRLLGLGLAGGVLFGLAAPGARAEGEGTNFMEDRVAQLLMQQAQAASMNVCEAVLIPISGNQYRLEYRVVRPGQPQVPRPANAMAAVVANPAGCPR
jgi:hypothetical protein